MGGRRETEKGWNGGGEMGEEGGLGKAGGRKGDTKGRWKGRHEGGTDGGNEEKAGKGREGGWERTIKGVRE